MSEFAGFIKSPSSRRAAHLQRRMPAESQQAGAGNDGGYFLDGAAKQVKVPTLVAGGAKSPGSLKAAVERVHAAIPGSQLRWLEGQTHNLAAEPAAAMAKEFFLGR